MFTTAVVYMYTVVFSICLLTVKIDPSTDTINKINNQFHYNIQGNFHSSNFLFLKNKITEIILENI